jgi:hypothetical protein
VNVDDELLEPFRAVGGGRARVQHFAALEAAVAEERPLADPRAGRLMLAGDWHGNSVWAGKALSLAARQGVSTVLQLGDFGFSANGEGVLDVLSITAAAFDLTLLVVDGNHEDFPLLERFPVLTDGPAAGLRPVRPRLWHLPRGTRWTWRGADDREHRWLAVGGAVSVDRQLRTEGYSWWPGEELTAAEAERIAGEGTADVLVCHDRPRAAAVALGDRPGLWWDRAPRAWARDDLARSDAHSDRVQSVVDAVQPRHVWHGHLHRRTDVLVDPATWGGICEIHGVAADEMSWNESTAMVGCDGALIAQDV